MRTDLPPAPPPSGPPDADSRRRGRVPWRFRPLAAYAAVLALTLLALTLTLRLWNLDFRSPTSYRGDGALHLMFTKGLVENGWYLTNPSLGAPGEMDMREFPAVDTLPALLIKGLGLFTHDAALLNNLFFLLTFPLTSLGAFCVCRQIGLRTGSSLLCALLYAFAPYHFFRGESHLYLSAYFVVPPAVLVAWWIAEGRLLRPGGWRRQGRLGLAGGLCLLVSTSGVYYPFFAGIILVTASLLALGARRDWRHCVAGGGLTALLVAGMLACLVPTLTHLRRHPGYPASLRRAEEAEIFGLKIVQILLPADGYRVRAIGIAKERYNRHSPLVNENTSAAAGVIGAAGFLVLIGWLLFRPVARPTPAAGGEQGPGVRPPPGGRFLDSFSVFNAVAVLYGTIGGFGEFFALIVTPQVRALNRISVFIDFFALVAVAFCLDSLAGRWTASRTARAVGWTGLGALLVLGLLDQSRPVDPAEYRTARRECQADRQFFGQIAASLPPGAMIFQLPYMGFPENGPEEQLEDYSFFHGYVLTSGLRWSYGAMRDSAGDQWQQDVARLPLEAGVRQLALGGFRGIHVERGGYADHGAALEAGLRPLLGAPVVAAPERAFFSLSDYTRALRASLTPEQWRQEADLARHRVYVRFGTGFNYPARKPEPASRWTRREADLTLTNPSGQTRRVGLRMLASTDRTAPLSLVMSRGQDRWTWTLNQEQQALSATLELPPGESDVHFSCHADGRPSARAWLLTDFRIEQDHLPADAPVPVPPLNPPTPAAAAAPTAAP